MERGFSTLELMIALTLFCIVLSGVAAALYANNYWSVTLALSGEGLSVADKTTNMVRLNAETNFQSASSTKSFESGSCVDGETCYSTEIDVINISPCAKYASVHVSWQVPSYPTTTTSLSSFLSNNAELIARGGDCGLSAAHGWENMREDMPSIPLQGTPVGIDVLGGRAYVIEREPSQIEIIDRQSVFLYIPEDGAVFNAIDVAREISTGRIYAYIAASSTQLQIVDVTDAAAPLLIGSTTLAGVPVGLQAGWRLQYYDGLVYMATRFISGLSAKEFHILDVSNQKVPVELGAYKLNTSPYAILVRDQYIDGAYRRYAYLATTHASKELMVLDVSDPQHIAPVKTCDLPGSQQGTSLHMLGDTLYVGRENVPNGGEDLYAFDAHDPTGATFCTPISRVDINDDRYSRHVQAIRASGDYVFVATNNTTNAHGKIQVRSTDTTKNLSELETLNIDALTENGMDIDSDENVLYAVSAGNNPLLYMWTSEE